MTADAPAKLRFQKGGSDAEGCPAAGEACAAKAFVTPGDLVVTKAGAGDFACATFTGGAPKFATTSGFLDRSALAAAPAAANPDWTGEWRSGDEKRLSLAEAGATVAIDGEASIGSSDPDRVARGGVNTGTIEARAAPAGEELDDGETLPIDAAQKSDSDFCRVRMWRLGPYLVASDNLRYGGANVTFTGVYRRG